MRPVKDRTRFVPGPPPSKRIEQWGAPLSPDNSVSQLLQESDVELHRMKEEGLKRNHTREFKLECCRQVATGQKCPAQVCREHDSLV